MSKYLITILVVFGIIAAGAGAYFAISRNSNPPAPEPATNYQLPLDAAQGKPATSTPPTPEPATSTPPPAPSRVEGPPAPKREPQEYIIEIWGNTDWRPPSHTIRVGDTVTFVNRDDALHWPGADPHPTHSALAAFDALGGISKGQTYSHTFRTPGAIGYHEHLIEEDPPTVGYITVLP